MDPEQAHQGTRAGHDGPGSRLETSRPTLLLDGGSRVDLGVVRSLGLTGIPVHLLTHNRRSITTTSRFVTAVHAFPPPNAPDEVRLERLRRIVAGLDRRPVMLPTGDRALSFLSRCRGSIGEVLDHDLAPSELIERCLWKDRFALWASAAGVAVPTTFVPTDAADVRTRAGDLHFPVFVKPAVHEIWADLPPGIVGHVKGERLNNAADLIRLFERLEPFGAHRTVVQEFVPGPDQGHASVHAYLDSSRTVVGVFSGRKVRIAPPHRGLGVLVRSELIPEALDVAVTALQTLGFVGMAVVNLKFDAERGGFKLLEINCRYSTWTELPTRCGCNLPAAAYAVITGQQPAVGIQREGVAWWDLRRDWKAMSTYRREGEWTWGSYLRSLAAVRHGAYFAWDDPLPFFWSMVGRGGGQ